MKKDPFMVRDIYYYIEEKNKEMPQKRNKKESPIYLLSDQKDKKSLSFFKTFLINNNTSTLELSNNNSSKKIIKVNTDNRSRSKKSVMAPKVINSVKRSSKIKIDNLDGDNISMSQRIAKFESRIDNLLNVINNFENNFINSSESEKIKEEFNSIINKKIYKNRIDKNHFHKSFNKTEYNNTEIFNDNNNSNVLKASCIMDIKNINININNNNYENNYFITQSSFNKRSHLKLRKKNQNALAVI